MKDSTQIASTPTSSMLLVTVDPASNSRSISPMTPSPSRERRGVRFFRAIIRKLARRASGTMIDDLSLQGDNDADSGSSSTDSCSSSTSTGERCSRKSKWIRTNVKSNDSFNTNCSLSPKSSTSSTDSLNKVNATNGSNVGTLARALENLSLRSGRPQRSLSCEIQRDKTPSSHSRNHNSNNTKSRSSKKSAPKRILRSPARYTYVRGISGLPTVRVPLNNSKMHYSYYNSYHYTTNYYRSC